jgi:hypothetical protein
MLRSGMHELTPIHPAANNKNISLAVKFCSVQAAMHKEELIEYQVIREF